MSQATSIVNNTTILSSLTIQTDAGTASPSATILQILGGTNVSTSAAGNIILIDSTAAPSPLTTKGDLYTYTTMDARLGVGLDGQVLTADSGQPTGLSWSTPSSGVTSVSGTANRITSTGGATPVIDISASYVGQSSITTLGTITTGVWNGTTIAVADGGTGATTLTGVLTGNGTGAITANAITQYGVVIGGASNAVASTAVGNAGQVLQSGGAGVNPSYSTATYPSTATGTGTILRADGTNWTATTSTYPSTNAVSTLLYASAANVMSALATANNGTLVTSNTGVPSILAGPGTTGNILQSNAAAAPSFSTATYPSTATSAGKILIADGTNWVASTPTYPNASATSRKILVSDGTNFVASTETWAVPSTSGNVLTSDGTNWTSAAPAGGGAWIFISSQTASASATINFTGLTSTYQLYRVLITDVIPATDDAFFYMRTSTDNGASYDAGASDYGWTAFGTRYDLATLTGLSDAADAQINLSNSTTVGSGSAANEQGNYIIDIYNPLGTKFTYVNTNAVFVNSGGLTVIRLGSGARLSAADVDAVRFLYSTGNIASGVFKLYGLSAT